MGTAPVAQSENCWWAFCLKSLRSSATPERRPWGHRVNRHWEPEVAGRCARTSRFCKDQDPAGR